METVENNLNNLFEKHVVTYDNKNYIIYYYNTCYSLDEMFTEYCTETDCFSTYRMILYDSSYNLLFDLYILHSDQHVIKCRFINNLNKYVSEQYIFDFLKSSIVHGDDIAVDIDIDEALEKKDNDESFYNKNYKFVDKLSHLYVFE